MIIDLFYDALRRTNSKTEQSKIDGSEIAECQRNSPALELLENKQNSSKSKYKFTGSKKGDYQVLENKTLTKK